MSLNGITSAAVSGLQAAQTGLRSVSDNIANIDTPGYVRKVVDQSSVASNGLGSGVSISQVRLAADRFLQSASLDAASRSGAAGAASSLWSQAQGLFGDPSEDSSFFASLDSVFSAFSTLASAPTSSAAKAAAVDQVGTFFGQAQALSGQLQTLRDQADTRIGADVDQVNQLLSQIDSLNVAISRGSVQGDDATAPANRQLQLIDQLSQMMDIKVTPRTAGGVTVRASDGYVLAGDGAATLSYKTSNTGGELSVTSASGQTQLMGGRLGSGELKGLLDLRNQELPAIASQLSELVSQTADTLNAVHNAYSTVPAPASLTGRDMNQSLSTALYGFTGATSVAIVNSAGVVQRRVDIDFSAGTMSTDGGTAVSFTPGNFAASLNTSLGSAGSASFSGGVLSLSAASGYGVAVADSATNPARNAGRGFSDVFGLNDLVKSSGVYNYNTGLSASDPHGFTAGDKITFQINGSDGTRLTNLSVAIPSGGSMTDLLTALNAPGTGVGLYGAFNLDANGQMSFKAQAGSGVSLGVVADATRHGTDGPSLTTMFGIDPQARASRAADFSVRADIAADPSKLSMAKLDLTVAAGKSSLASADTRGADALSQAGKTSTTFDAAGGLSKATQTLSAYSASLAGTIARKAAAADAAGTSAAALATEANARRSSVEGVNLDQELIQLTTYQQAYNASARMIQAAKEMYDVLLNMTN